MFRSQLLAYARTERDMSLSQEARKKKTSSSLLETDGIETVIKDESLTAWRAVWCHKSPGVRSTRWNGVFGDIAVCWSARTTS